MASSFLKGLVTDYGKLGYQLWHRPLKMASLVYEREIGVAYRITSMGVMIMMSYLTMKVNMTMTMKTGIPDKALVIKCCFAFDEVELVTGKIFP